jgi:hypothetical protein
MKITRPTVSEKDEERLASEWQEMLIALGQAVNGWAHIENAMATLLGVLIGGQGHVVYFSVSNTETRIKMTDRVLMSKLLHQYHSKGFAQAWAKILRRINRAKNTRNKIIHWNTSEHWIKNKDRLVVRHKELHTDTYAAMQDLIEWDTSPEPGDCPLCARDVQLPGMSAHDVLDATQNFERISYDIEIFTRSMRALNQNNSGARTRASVLRLAKHLRIADPLLADLTPEESAELQRLAKEPPPEPEKRPYRGGSYTVSISAEPRKQNASGPEKAKKWKFW